MTTDYPSFFCPLFRPRQRDKSLKNTACCRGLNRQRWASHPPFQMMPLRTQTLWMMRSTGYMTVWMRKIPKTSYSTKRLRKRLAYSWRVCQLVSRFLYSQRLVCTVPDISPPNEHPPSAFFLPTKLLDYVCPPKSTKAHNDQAMPTYKFLRKAKGIQSLSLALSWTQVFRAATRLHHWPDISIGHLRSREICQRTWMLLDRQRSLMVTIWGTVFLKIISKLRCSLCWKRR